MMWLGVGVMVGGIVVIIVVLGLWGQADPQRRPLGGTWGTLQQPRRGS